MNKPIVLCWSGGKDSLLSLHELRESGEWDVAALLTTVTREYDRVSMHGVRRTLLHQQARSLGIELAEVFLQPHAPNAEYERRMAEQLLEFRRGGIRHVAFGDLFLEDLRDYRVRQLAALEMQCVFPLWGRETRALYETFLSRNDRAVTVCVDPRVLNASHLGRELDAAFLADLPAEADPCGENGEFHTFVYDGPLFAEPIAWARGEIVERDSFLYCDLISVTSGGPVETNTVPRTSEESRR